MTPYYADEWVTLYHGDALDVLPGVASGSAGAVILDPPYSFESISVRGRDDGAAGTSGAPTMLFHRTLVETRRILRAGGIAPTERCLDCGKVGYESAAAFRERVRRHA